MALGASATVSPRSPRVCLRRRLRRLAARDRGAAPRTRRFGSVPFLRGNLRRRLASALGLSAMNRAAHPAARHRHRSSSRTHRVAAARTRPYRELCAVAACDYSGDPAAPCAAVAEFRPGAPLRSGPPRPDAYSADRPSPDAASSERGRRALRLQHFIDYPIGGCGRVARRHDARPRWAIGSFAVRRLAASLGAGAIGPLGRCGRRCRVRVSRGPPSTSTAIIDVGDSRDVADPLRPAPSVYRASAVGGALLTDADRRIARHRYEAAEQRKRSVGFGGAGAADGDMLIAASRRRWPTLFRGCGVRDVVLCGNGGRIPGFAETIRAAPAAYVVLPATLVAALFGGTFRRTSARRRPRLVARLRSRVVERRRMTRFDYPGRRHDGWSASPRPPSPVPLRLPARLSPARVAQRGGTWNVESASRGHARTPILPYAVGSAPRSGERRAVACMTAVRSRLRRLPRSGPVAQARRSGRTRTNTIARIGNDLPPPPGSPGFKRATPAAPGPSRGARRSIGEIGTTLGPFGRRPHALPCTWSRSPRPGRPVGCSTSSSPGTCSRDARSSENGLLRGIARRARRFFVRLPPDGSIDCLPLRTTRIRWYVV